MPLPNQAGVRTARLFTTFGSRYAARSSFNSTAMSRNTLSQPMTSTMILRLPSCAQRSDSREQHRVVSDNMFWSADGPEASGVAGILVVIAFDVPPRARRHIR